MRLGRKSRRTLREIGEELRREDPLFASMLSESTDLGGEHPENGKARRRRADHPTPYRSSYMPFVMF